MAQYPSGKGEVCKTFMRAFDSLLRLIFYSRPMVSILKGRGVSAITKGALGV